MWVQGCFRNCEGCVAGNSHDINGGMLLSTSVLASMYINETETEGITISGGEPFLQAEAIAEMILLIREKRPDYGTIIYTGNTYEELLSSKERSVRDLLSVTDLLIDGEYKKELSNERYAIGSSNQRLLRLTDRYPDEIINGYYTTGNNNRITINIDHNRLFMTGVPSKESLVAWKNIKNIGKRDD